jgi:hypothetical protein
MLIDQNPKTFAAREILRCYPDLADQRSADTTLSDP